MYAAGVRFVTDVQYSRIFSAGTLSFTLQKKAEYKVGILKHQQYYGLLLNSMLKKMHQKKFLNLLPRIASCFKYDSSIL